MFATSALLSKAPRRICFPVDPSIKSFQTYGDGTFDQREFNADGNADEILSKSCTAEVHHTAQRRHCCLRARRH